MSTTGAPGSGSTGKGSAKVQVKRLLAEVEIAVAGPVDMDGTKYRPVPFTYDAIGYWRQAQYTKIPVPPTDFYSYLRAKKLCFECCGRGQRNTVQRPVFGRNTANKNGLDYLYTPCATCGGSGKLQPEQEEGWWAKHFAYKQALEQEAARHAAQPPPQAPPMRQIIIAPAVDRMLDRVDPETGEIREPEEAEEAEEGEEE
jgi:hypothetical protein